MKYLYSFFILFLLCYLWTPIHSQIPNNSFEEWEANDGYETPEGWEINGDKNDKRIVKDTISVEGQFSVKCLPKGGHWTDCGGIFRLQTELDPVINGDKSIYFSMKATPEEQDQDTIFAGYIVEYYYNGMRVDSESRSFYDELKDFTQYEIPFPDRNIDSIRLIMTGGATTTLDGLDCKYDSYVWYDNIYIDERSTTSIDASLSQSDKFTVYPVPSSGTINIKDNKKNYSHYRIYNLQGEILQNGKLSGSSIQINQKGPLLLKLTDKNGNSSATRIINY